MNLNFIQLCLASLLLLAGCSKVKEGDEPEQINSATSSVCSGVVNGCGIRALAERMKRVADEFHAISSQEREKFALEYADRIKCIDISLPDYRERMCAAELFWFAFGNALGLMNESGVDGRKSVSYMYECMCKYKQVSFSVPLTPKPDEEDEIQFRRRIEIGVCMRDGYNRSIGFWHKRIYPKLFDRLSDVDKANFVELYAAFVKDAEEAAKGVPWRKRIDL